VIRTRVGYAGGTTLNPTYYRLGDHSETVQVDFDPGKVSYTQLLAAFWNGHDASADPYSRQYRSAIFYSSAKQKVQAEESLAQHQSLSLSKLFTSIEPLSKFYLAENYHQKYYLQQTPSLFVEMSEIYPNINSLTNSTAAARINGYIGGFGDPQVLQKEIGSLGLSEAGQQELLDVTESGLTQACPTGLTIN
jgi:peptide-methionine (S)-S-oxide reductase